MSTRVALLLCVELFVAMAAATPARAACGISGPSMLDLYLAGRDLGEATHRLLEPAARHSPALLSGLENVDAAMATLNTQVWGLYWVSLYNRRMLEVLEQVDADRKASPVGPVRAYYTHWSASQLAGSAALALRAAEAVDASVNGATALPTADAAKLRQYVSRVGGELKGCEQPP